MEFAAHVGIDRPRRVLVADDDTDVCTLLELVLVQFGDVTVVNDAESALAALADLPPFDVIVSDFNLPGINGLEFVERVRRGTNGSVPILMISGHGKFVAERARAAGVNAFLDKPFALSDLRNAVTSLLPPRAARYA